MTGEHIRGIPRTYEKEITLADTPYTLSVGFNCVKVDTTGGNVRVNLPNVNYPIDVIKTSSDSYIVTVWVGGVQIGEVCGELSKITIENAEVTQDEPWYPYDCIVGIAGVSGDGGEVLAKDRFGRVIAGGRGVAGTDDATIINAAIAFCPVLGGKVVLGPGKFYGNHITIDRPLTLEGMGMSETMTARGITSINGLTNTSVIDLINDDDFVTLRDFSVVGKTTEYGTGTVGIEVGRAHDVHIERVYVPNHAVGIHALGKATNLKIYHSWIENSRIGLIYNTNNEGTGNLSVVNCVIQNTQYNIELHNLTRASDPAQPEAVIVGNSIAACANESITIGNSQNVIICDNFFRSPGTAVIHPYAIKLLKSNSYISIKNNVLDGIRTNPVTAGLVKFDSIESPYSDYIFIEGNTIHNCIGPNIAFGTTGMNPHGRIRDNEGFIGAGEVRTFAGSIATLTENAFNSLDNPFGQNVVLLSLDIYVSTAATATSPNIDCGIGSDAEADYTTLFNDLPGESIGFYQSTIVTPGAQTVPQLWESGSGNRYLNMSIKDAAATGMVATYVVTVRGL